MREFPLRTCAVVFIRGDLSLYVEVTGENFPNVKMNQKECGRCEV